MSDFPDVQAPLPSPKGKRAGRLPQQERSQTRIAKVLEAAEQLLGEVGPDAASIPEISKLSGVPRASIYQFFPDKYVLFAHLARLQMERIGALIVDLQPLADEGWKGAIHRIVRGVAEYYNTHPAAAALLMRGNFTPTDRKAHEEKDAMIGNLLRGYLQAQGVLAGLPQQPDAATLSVEIAFACMKYGYLAQGHISEAICDEAAAAAIVYLSRWE
ncbi:TetR/AcrR family transcriptional regulator [Pseudomonas citronellolis]|uniref:TetR/AcrR family transcriptional regulator n=1 Tax=Pseudomonas citronellolis TaxID=53408 RepID=UPI00209EB976|nr:TetR/AcrR family transcriptional regulator [Pseudomonas citronellolis]MCP1603729.1 AcrR family transcriptional regulator [Pseudomonas citronellolis]MCP1653204.1 AcrR family transcriptional regulator [Pseudomonas citronellolis]MCP1720476.1 AcrR family transcriptional regulator [Pseudomonas citronellolis]